MKLPKASVSHAQFLSLGGKLVEHLTALAVDRFLVVQDILEADAPMRAHLAE